MKKYVILESLNEVNSIFDLISNFQPIGSYQIINNPNVIALEIDEDLKITKPPNISIQDFYDVFYRLNDDERNFSDIMLNGSHDAVLLTLIGDSYVILVEI